MGYGTKYKLEIMCPDGVLPVTEKIESKIARYCYKYGSYEFHYALEPKIVSEIEQFNKEDGTITTIKFFGFDETNRNAKWYDHEIEIKELSKKFPEYVFVLHGEGESSGDIWTKYFLDGKIQIEKAKITVGEFDERKLR